MSWSIKFSLDRIRNKCRARRWFDGDAVSSYNEYLDALKVALDTDMISEEEFYARKADWEYEYEMEGFKVVELQ